jgi:hypothetical protein
MAYATATNMAMEGDPVYLGAPDAIQPDMMEPEVVDYAPLETALINYLHEGHAAAVSVSEPIKRDWVVFMRMARAISALDDPDDTFTDLGVWIATIAKAKDTLRAQIVNDLIPDPGSMDFFRLDILREFWERYGEIITKLLQDKFRAAQPQDCEGGFIDLFDMEVDDWLTIGNMLTIVSNEQEQGDLDADHVISGPTPQYLDPFNVWPWDIDVNTFRDTNTTIYQPISRYELRDGEGSIFTNVDKVIESETCVSLPRRDATADSGADVSSLITKLYPRYTYLGRWPSIELKEVVKEKYDGMVAAMGAAYGFDPAQCDAERWWQMEYVGDTLICCRPFPLTLPKGRGPILHEVLYKVNGQLWGEGLYHRVQWDERILNFFHRCVINIAGMAADPPYVARRHLMDPEWLQRRGEGGALEAGEAIWVIGNDGGQKPFEPLYPPIEVIRLLQDQKKEREDNLSELIGVTSAMEGEDKTKTATQNANNLQQSLGMAKYWEKKLETGYLREIVCRMYAVMRQVMTLSGMPEQTTMSFEEMTVQSIPVAPEMLADETFVSVVMTGLNSPGNKFNQSKAFGEFVNRWVATGGLNIPEAIKTDAKILGLGNAEALIAQVDPMAAQAAMFNLTSVGGPNAMKLASPAVMQALAQQQGGGLPGAPMPPGPNVPTGPAGLPMAPNAPAAGGM